MAPPISEFRAFVRVEGRGGTIPQAHAIRSHFEQIGNVLDVYNPPRSQDTSYVSFSAQEELEAALTETTQVIEGLVCTVQRALPRGSLPTGGASAMGSSAPASQSSDRVYVAGLLESVTEDALRNYFSHFGMVIDVYMPMDRQTGMRKPFAFITMSSPEEVTSILEQPGHAMHDGHTFDCMMADPRGSKGGGKGGGKGGDMDGFAMQHPQFQYGSPKGGYMQAPLAAYGGVSYARSQNGSSHSPFGSGVGHFNSGGQKSSGGKGWQAPSVAEAGPGPIQGVPGLYRLFVFGMAEGLNADMLRGHFARHGEITDIYCPPLKPDVAYITFESEAQLQDAEINSGLRIAGFWVEGVKRAEAREKGKSKGKGKGKGKQGPY